MMRTATASRLIGRAVAEAVGAFATPARADQVIQLALRWGRLLSVPEEAHLLTDFVDGPLFLAAEELLGEEAARAIRAELVTIVQQIEPEEISAVRASWPSMPGPADHVEEVQDFELIELSPRPLTPTDPAPKLELPTLLLASCDPTEVQRVALAMSGIAFVEPVADALAVLEGLGAQRTPLVLLDVRRPTLQVETLVAMQPEMPDGTRVVVWGERTALRKQLADAGQALPDEWIVCGPDLSAEDVARICKRLFA